MDKELKDIRDSQQAINFNLCGLNRQLETISGNPTMGNPAPCGLICQLERLNETQEAILQALEALIYSLQDRQQEGATI